jgi:hypothetical protein
MADEQAKPPAEEQPKLPAKRKRRARRMSPLVPWVRVHGPSMLLTLLGLTMLGLGVFVEDSDAAAVALVLLGPLIVVVGVLLELFAPRLLRLALSQSGLSAELAPPLSADELEQAGLPKPAAEEIVAALDEWIENVTRLLPIEIERRVREELDAREQHDRRMRELAEQFVKQQRERDEHERER